MDALFVIATAHQIPPPPLPLLQLLPLLQTLPPPNLSVLMHCLALALVTKWTIGVVQCVTAPLAPLPPKLRLIPLPSLLLHLFPLLHVQNLCASYSVSLASSKTPMAAIFANAALILVKTTHVLTKRFAGQTILDTLASRNVLLITSLLRKSAIWYANLDMRKTRKDVTFASAKRSTAKDRYVPLDLNVGR